MKMFNLKTWQALVLAGFTAIFSLSSCDDSDDPIDLIPIDTDFKSNFENIYFRGGPNGWGATAFTLVEDNTWELDSVIMSNLGEVKFKLANTDDWTHIDWGMAEDDTQIALSGYNMAFKEIDPEIDPDTGEKIGETLVDGGNTDATIIADDLQEGEWYYTFTFIDLGEGPDAYKLTINAVAATGNQGAPYTEIGIVGSALTGSGEGWPSETVATDVIMYDKEANVRHSTLYLYGLGGSTVPEDSANSKAKFRADQDWGFNWGGASFPEGALEQNGTDFLVAEDGLYYVTFEDPFYLEEAKYNFEAASIGIIGNGANGWGDTDDVVMTSTSEDPNILTVTLDLTAGVDPDDSEKNLRIKFRMNGKWEVNWGAGDEGKLAYNGPDIDIAETGNYTVTFNPSTLEYSLTKN